MFQMFSILISCDKKCFRLTQQKNGPSKKMFFLTENNGVRSKTTRMCTPPGVARPCYRPKSNKWCSCDWRGVILEIRALDKAKQEEKKAAAKCAEKVAEGGRGFASCSCAVVGYTAVSFCFPFFFLFFFFPASVSSCRLYWWPFVCNLASSSFLWVDTYNQTRIIRCESSRL